MKQCQVLLEEPDLETAVRVGDVYGIMIEHLAREENYSKVGKRSQKFSNHEVQISKCSATKPTNLIKLDGLFYLEQC